MIDPNAQHGAWQKELLHSLPKSHDKFFYRANLEAAGKTLYGEDIARRY
jgi:hypothetical protein